MNTSRWIAALFGLFLLGIMAPRSACADSVSGSVILPAGETIPAGAVVQVELHDLTQSKSAGKAEIKTAAGKSQAAYEIALNPANKGHRLSVGARVTLRGRLLFISESQTDVPDKGPRNGVNVHVNKVGG